MKNSKFDKLFNTIMESATPPEGSEVYANKYNDEQKQAVIDTMNKYHFKFNDTDLNLLCAEMYDDRGFYPDHVRRLTQDQFASIVKNMISNWYDDHTEPIAESVKSSKKKKVIKEAANKIDYKNIFNTMKEIFKANKDAFGKLKLFLKKRVSSYPEGFYEWAFVGMPDEKFTGLKDVANWKQFGFKLTKEQEQVLKDFNNQYDEEFGDALENRVFSFFNKAGLSEINDIYNRRMDDDWDDQEEIENQSVLQESEGYDSSVEVDDDIDSIVGYWSNDVKIVEEGKRGYTRSKLKKFASEFYNIGVYGDYDVTDLNDTMNGEYGTPKYAPTFGYDKYVFVILLPNGALQVEDGEGVHDFRNHEQAKKYVIQQCKTEGVAGMEEDQNESVTESKKVNTKKKIIKQSKKVTKKKKVVRKSKKN